MTMICCSLRVDSSAEVAWALECAETARDEGAQLVEWRVDSLAEESDGVDSVARLLASSPLPSIVTCRSVREGGYFDGSESDRVSFLEAIGTSSHPPRYIDFELADYQRSANLRQKIDLVVAHHDQARDVSTGLILSSHDFEQRPPDLIQRIEAMTGAPACSMAKVAWHARSLRDNLEAFDLLRGRSKPMIALCMGDFGGMSRVLAPKFGGFLTFATLDEVDETAPGQPTIRDLRGLYRFDSITEATKVHGIVGWPVRASLSPIVHNAGFGAIGYDGVFVGMPIPPEWEHFKATIGAFLDHDGLDLAGLSVTMPHKEHLVRLVKEYGGELDQVSTRCGAANTLLVDSGGSLRALNTDAPAAVASLADAMGVTPDGLAEKRIAVVGAGGVSRAIVAGLIGHGAQVVVFNRSRERAEKLLADLGSDLLTLGEPGEMARGGFQAFVNATSIGSPSGDAPDQSPLPEEVHLDESITILETVYAPSPTRLVLEARERGARVATGEDMFIRQAILQFEAWTGRTPPEGLFAERLRSR